MYLQVVTHKMRLLRENARHLDPEAQDLRGLWEQNFGAVTSFVAAVDELNMEQKICGGDDLCMRRKG